MPHPVLIQGLILYPLKIDPVIDLTTMKLISHPFLAKIYLFMSLTFFNSVPLHAQDELNIMTFNIRYDTWTDTLNSWQFRKNKVASQILFHQSHIVGVQEALSNQMKDLQKLLENYQYVGVGREGNDKGEYSAIFYDVKRIKLLQSKTFWHSEQPEAVGKKGWDAALPRIVTWAKFRDKKTRKAFYVFNTHYDNKGIAAKRESSRLLLQKVKEIAGKAPCLITGDFNSFPADEPITILRDINNPDHFIDTKIMSLNPHFGPDGTFNEFKSGEIGDEPIDYIFLKNKVEVLRHGTLSESWKGKYSSDHFPVLATVLIK